MKYINKERLIVFSIMAAVVLCIPAKIVIAQTTNQTNSVENKPIIELIKPYKCDAKPFKYLKGHMLSEVLSLKLPPNTRIYRYDDEAAQYDKTKNRLNIELDDKTFVRRVYCS